MEGLQLELDQSLTLALDKISTQKEIDRTTVSVAMAETEINGVKVQILLHVTGNEEEFLREDETRIKIENDDEMESQTIISSFGNQ